MVKTFLLFALLFVSGLPKQQLQPVSVVDLVKIKNDKKEEALYFYKNNWLTYRKIALEKGLIKSYQLLLNKPGANSDFDIILITTYKDSIQYKESEANFAQIIKAERPTGPRLLNELKPNNFRENVSTKITEEISSN